MTRQTNTTANQTATKTNTHLTDEERDQIREADLTTATRQARQAIANEDYRPDAWYDLTEDEQEQDDDRAADELVSQIWDTPATTTDDNAETDPEDGIPTMWELNR